ncbi:alpha/beta hydrolase [Paeniglutamicibacter cryotolerans]|uniref:Alpha/beta hydrolase fold-5 domain-containing protein n=1 Tax=Paeniglutamicibacter cryotolerans TaxID=670079 RepID=A0A839QQL4_9MICC|nr:alpha/beta hydrolase [Paeniglutamicibacter cryotolerans]MBB2997064.1 hypothetical protein [Paeniglutamicibacter cryotolerans]
MTGPSSLPREGREHSRDSSVTRIDVVFFWATRIVSSLGVLACAWAAIATGSMLLHGHPAYAILLGSVFVICAVIGLRSWLHPTAVHRKFKILRGIGVVASTVVFAAVVWLIPYGAVEPALAAMNSDGSVSVTETADQIVMTPLGTQSEVGLFFQPGALVDARAYAAVLRPLAENGHTVIIPKQPFGIAFLATGAFASARAGHPPVDSWVVGGHSLGGVVSAIDAQTFSTASSDAAVGILFFASYPASNMSELTIPALSISGSNDLLATPEKINASRPNLPPSAIFTVIDGASHANFGDYGPQAGDGTPTISPDAARTAISRASLAFVDSIGK